MVGGRVAPLPGPGRQPVRGTDWPAAAWAEIPQRPHSTQAHPPTNTSVLR